ILRAGCERSDRGIAVSVRASPRTLAEAASFRAEWFARWLGLHEDWHEKLSCPLRDPGQAAARVAAFFPSRIGTDPFGSAGPAGPGRSREARDPSPAAARCGLDPFARRG